MDAETLVREYLQRLEAEAQRLPEARREELIEEVREHVEMALAQADHPDGAAVRNILDRLGPPDAIVSAEVASETGSLSAAATTIGSGWGPTEIIAVLLLTVGAVLLPVLGPLVGLVFVWASGHWTRRLKLIATVIAVALLLLPILLLLLSLFGMASAATA